MTTVDDVLNLQKADNILYSPLITDSSPAFKVAAVSSSGTLDISLYNTTTSSNVYAYITGLAISFDYSICLLQSDGQTPYYPANPTTIGSPLLADCAIALGAPGSTRTVTIPYLAGGRIWFCVDNTLTFLLNPGPGLVEPSVSNPSDPNYSLSWDFCEFTYNSTQLYANISYVDFVCLPIALTLIASSGSTQQVSGLPASGLSTVCTNLVAQNTLDGAGWDKLVITNNGVPLRALSPSNGIVFNPSLFEDYWTSYVDQVWSKYVSDTLSIDTQSSWGVVNGYTSNDRTSLSFPTIGAFTKPSAKDIFSASSGAFAAQATNTAELLNVGARLDAGFNRSTLLLEGTQPDAIGVESYYGGGANVVTNHYARIVHEANLDGRGYTFPYDDVTPTGGEDQSGFVSDTAPIAFVVSVGGGNTYARRGKRGGGEVMKRAVKRSVGGWEEKLIKEVGEMRIPSVEKGELDLEKGEMSVPGEKLLRSSSEMSLELVLKLMFGSRIAHIIANATITNRITSCILPLLAFMNEFLASTASLPIRTILSRVLLMTFFSLLWLLGMLLHGHDDPSQKRVLQETLIVGSWNRTAAAAL